MANSRDEVVELDVGIRPEAAVSGPVLLQNDYCAFLTFNAVRQGTDRLYHKAGTAIVEIVMCSITKFGYPNDEALAGHPLYAKGLDAYGIFEVMHSSWSAEQAAQNRVSFPHSSRVWTKHYAFVFHDSTFECLAAEIKIEVSEEPYEQILHQLAGRILRDPVS